ncbi:MAG: L-histidine N(alpha)-methyltransferase [Betaproteobacteria bacterium]|nr:L-histidine N(alpha)-methyltransferase [Betaproteobacteria bacterium]
MKIDPPYRIVNRLHIDAKAEHARLVAGLRAAPAHIEPKYFYDELGCALYAAICQLDEYYPTRTERAIFQEHREAIAAAIGRGGTFVDLGAGDCCKAMSWLPFIEPIRYLAVDIAGPSLETALGNMAPEFPDTEMLGLVTDFSQRLEIPAELLAAPVTMFYPGSSIGNFTPGAAVEFLRQVRGAAGGGALLIGVDAKKPKPRLDAAYADALGVTAAFNLNALRHINRVLKAGFTETNWRHAGFYNEALGRIEMHLEAVREETIQLDGMQRIFRAGERIHSENSYKYARREFEDLLRESGYQSIQAWSNAAQEFWVFLARE